MSHFYPVVWTVGGVAPGLLWNRKRTKLLHAIVLLSTYTTYTTDTQQNHLQLSFLVSGFNLAKLIGYVLHQQVQEPGIFQSSTLFMCFIFISGQIATFPPYTIN
jgi:hypothetical protein